MTHQISSSYPGLSLPTPGDAVPPTIPPPLPTAQLRQQQPQQPPQTQQPQPQEMQQSQPSTAQPQLESQRPQQSQAQQPQPQQTKAQPQPQPQQPQLQQSQHMWPQSQLQQPQQRESQHQERQGIPCAMQPPLGQTKPVTASSPFAGAPTLASSPSPNSGATGSELHSLDTSFRSMSVQPGQPVQSGQPGQTPMYPVTGAPPRHPEEGAQPGYPMYGSAPPSYGTSPPSGLRSMAPGYGSPTDYSQYGLLSTSPPGYAGTPHGWGAPQPDYRGPLSQTSPPTYSGYGVVPPVQQAPPGYSPFVSDPIQIFMQEAEMMNSPADFMRPTMKKLPNNADEKKRRMLPMGVVLQPLAPVPDASAVPTVDRFATRRIPRCDNCRTYINPFVKWLANGRRWTCNICGTETETLSEYYAGLDEHGNRLDRFEKPELHKGSVEFLAPEEYTMRAPQPPVFFFVIDVAQTSVKTGFLDAAVAAIKQTIQSHRMPQKRLHVGIITFDSTVHFYNLICDTKQPKMIVVDDLKEVFLPLPHDKLTVDAKDGEPALLSLLDRLPELFRNNEVVESCLGTAIEAAHLAMKHFGGKMLVFAEAMPTLGELPLNPSRNDPKFLKKTDAEAELMHHCNEQYEELAVELSQAHISVELFIGPHQQYVDLATLSCLTRLTGGDIRYYPMFTMQEHGQKLQQELFHVLTRYMGWEAVMRVRVSRGWKVTRIYGHFFFSKDLLAMPNCHADQTFVVSIDADDNVNPDPILFIQSGLLYTNNEGQRVIRVHTYACETTGNFNEVINSVDVQATVELMACQFIAKSLKSNLADGWRKMQSQCQELVQVGQEANSEATQFFPMYVMGMLKSPAFRVTRDIGPDMRTFVWNRLQSLCIKQLSSYFYPRMMALHYLSDTEGQMGEDGKVILPAPMQLTHQSMAQDGVYLLEDGESILMWVGSYVNPIFLQRVFGVQSIQQLDVTRGEQMLGQTGDPMSTKVANIIKQVREEQQVPFMVLHIIRAGDSKEAKFFESLIEDRQVGLQASYPEFFQSMSSGDEKAAFKPQSSLVASKPQLDVSVEYLIPGLFALAFFLLALTGLKKALYKPVRRQSLLHA